MCVLYENPDPAIWVLFSRYYSYLVYPKESFNINFFSDKGKADLNRKRERHGPLAHASSSEGEEESRLGLITKQRPAQRAAPDSAKKRKRKRKKKSSEA